MTASPQDRYRALLAQPGFVADPGQSEAVAALEHLYHRLDQRPPPRGLYLWGDVGRGKTLLMDLLFQAVPGERKLRLHFNRFLARIHDQLRAEQGRRDPLAMVAKRLARRYRLLCFDEFQVNDIGDAMLLQRLFAALFEHGLVLVATSNIPIDGLFPDPMGLQRFQPGIRLLKQHCRELRLDGEHDHRRRQPVPWRTCVRPGQANFRRLFEEREGDAGRDAGELRLRGRALPVIRRGATTVWFDFSVLCGEGRSTLDYIELAERFDTVMLTGVPTLGMKVRDSRPPGAPPILTAADDPARRFIALVDELHDRGVALYLESELPPERLYRGEALSFAWRRTLSRLCEMQRPPN